MPHVSGRKGICPWTSTCPVIRRGYSLVDEYLPHVLERVFVHNTCPMCWRGHSSMGRIHAQRFGGRVFVHVDEYLPNVLGEDIRPWNEYFSHVFERVFVRRTNTCPMFLRGYSSTRRMLASQTEGEGNEYQCLFAFVFVRGVHSCYSEYIPAPVSKCHPLGKCENV